MAPIIAFSSGCLGNGGYSSSSSPDPTDSSGLSSSSSSSSIGDETPGDSSSSSSDNGNQGGDVEPDTPLVIPPADAEETDPAVTIVPGSQLLSTLSATPFRSPIHTDYYGVSDASKIGVKESEMSRVLYHVPTSGAKVYNAADYNITPNGEKNTVNLNNLLTSLQDVEGIKTLVFEKGTYTFSSTINIQNIEDLYIVGAPSDFVFSTWCTAFSVKNCVNLHFNDISLDYNPSSVVAGTVKSCDTSAKTVTISLYDEFNLSDARYNGGVINYGSYMEFTSAGGEAHPNPEGNLLYNSTGDNVKSISGGSYNASANELTLTFTSLKEVAAGTQVSVAFTMYENGVFIISDCENLYMEGCNIYHTTGMAINLNSVTNAYLNRTNLMLKPGSKRLMTATADGLHVFDGCGDLVLTGSLFENSHDDSINIKSFYKKVTSNYMRQITCTSSSTHTDCPIKAGDVIEIYNPENFELINTYTVKEVNRSLLTYTIEVNKMITEDISGMILGNVTRSPKVRINNCIFRNKRNRGILLQSRESEISGNAFYNIAHGAISLHSALDIFAEAIVPGNVTISNNKFINNNHGYGLHGDVAVFATGSNNDGCAGAVRNIKVENNFFYGNGQAAVYLRSTGDNVVQNNLFYNICAKYSNNAHCAAVYILQSTGASILNNRAVFANANSNFSFISEGADASYTHSNNTY